jgi:hypothetical protein
MQIDIVFLKIVFENIPKNYVFFVYSLVVGNKIRNNLCCLIFEKNFHPKRLDIHINTIPTPVLCGKCVLFFLFFSYFEICTIISYIFDYYRLFKR